MGPERYLRCHAEAVKTPTIWVGDFNTGYFVRFSSVDVERVFHNTRTGTISIFFVDQEENQQANGSSNSSENPDCTQLAAGMNVWYQYIHPKSPFFSHTSQVPFLSLIPEQ